MTHARLFGFCAAETARYSETACWKGWYQGPAVVRGVLPVKKEQIKTTP
ncbi:hypothetical protein [Roseobacter denitrificans]|uniref:Uncharacterized protein n=1 Tax=Roseobacter denitrificans (strain ATCC 33942 / OCh 114) TaxID=375451 RepID=Q160M9_ROSDO|nr:hypothetical protein [Roseobacter denitrificans]ABG33564.1 hypothetical protein RD1_4123 [Roseobacter denitrificans OCh 114]